MINEARARHPHITDAYRTKSAKSSEPLTCRRRIYHHCNIGPPSAHLATIDKASETFGYIPLPSSCIFVHFTSFLSVLLLPFIRSSSFHLCNVFWPQLVPLYRSTLLVVCFLSLNINYVIPLRIPHPVRLAPQIGTRCEASAQHISWSRQVLFRPSAPPLPFGSRPWRYIQTYSRSRHVRPPSHP